MRRKIVFIIALCLMAISTFGETKNDGNKYLFRPSERIEIGLRFDKKTLEYRPLSVSKAKKDAVKKRKYSKRQK